MKLREPAPTERSSYQLAVGVMLANGRPEMVNRAVRCFLDQTYHPRRLLVYDTGEEKLPGMKLDGVVHIHAPENGRIGLGPLRNEANTFAVRHMGAKILAHFDSDDWSHPSRIQDQVDLLVATGADVVGYHEMVFWDSTKCSIRVDPSKPIKLESPPDEPARYGCEGTVESIGEAWLFSSPHAKNLLGTSLCYWADTWLARPFPKQDHAEDHLWLLRIQKITGGRAGVYDPMMIASVHGGNTCCVVKPGCSEWKRLREADGRIGQVMAL